MVKVCLACGKKNLNPDLSFHRFPKNNVLKQTWLKLLDFPNNKVIPRFSYICSDHFSDDDFEIKIIKCLRPTSIPLPLSQNNFGSPQEISSDSTVTETSPRKKRPLSDVVLPESFLIDNPSDLLLNKETIVAENMEPSRKRYKISQSRDRDQENYDTSSTATASETENTIEMRYYGELAKPCIIESRQQFGPMDGNEYELSQNAERFCANSDSSATATASETENFIIEMINKGNLDKSGSEFRGRMGLIEKSNKKNIPVAFLEPADFRTEDMIKENLKHIKSVVQSQNNKIRTLQQSVRRLRGRVNSLKSLMMVLKEKNLISDSSATTIIMASLPEASTELFNRLLKGPSKQKYTPALRSFALTLSFYSPKAYNFVRRTFNRSLPNIDTISKWYRSINGAPGWTQEAFNALKLKVDDQNKTGKKILCNLVLDEMSIRKQVEWSGQKFYGYVDVGTNLETDTLPEAKEALVFMLVALNSSWKIPVGYFLLDGLNGTDKAELVLKCLKWLDETGVIITSMTFDGAPVNFTMAKVLGADFSDPTKLKTYFLHPKTSERVFIFLDPCHMLKLVRNCFGSTYKSTKTLKDNSKNDISWTYLEQLVNLQYTEGLHAANKIKRRHLNWVREKMKVKIAAQVLSKSVADALGYLEKDLGIETFKNSEPTAKFIQLFNDLFDMLNSKNRFAKYSYKRPLSANTKSEFFEYFEKIQFYINSLTLDGKPVLQSGRKTGFLGFLICIQSLKELYEIHVESKENLKYNLTYKLSQDHLELFFGAIRSKGGFNNNPTAKQFEAAYKRLIVHSEIKAGDTGNVINLDSTSILFCSSGNSTVNENGEDLQETTEYRQFECEVRKDIINYNFISAPEWDFTLYVQDVLSYIAGFTALSLKKCITCPKCLSFLQSSSTLSLLQTRKEFKNLTKASELIIDICKTGEKYFRFLCKTKGLFNKNIKSLIKLLQRNTLNNLPTSVFDYFGDHFYEDDPLEGHCMKLIKLALEKYFKIRIHHETNKILDSQSPRIRSQQSRLIIFKNQ